MFSQGKGKTLSLRTVTQNRLVFQNILAFLEQLSNGLLGLPGHREAAYLPLPYRGDG